MAYDEELADRVRATLDGLGVRAVEQKMFGGIAFMVRGHMTVGVLGDDLMARVGKDAHDSALALPGAREMDFTGRPMQGFLCVDETGCAADEDLRTWVQRGLDFTGTLPPK